MEPGEYLRVIGVGTTEDWEAGRGSFYYIEDKNGEKALPVFTTDEQVANYLGRTLNTPTAHIEMLESLGAEHAPALTAGAFVVLPLDAEGVAKVALMIGADYLVRNIRYGSRQEIIRVPK